MPATAEDIAALMRASAIATWSDASILARYPNARDGTVTPADGYCDDAAHAEILVDDRGALIGAEPRRFSAEVADIVWPDLTAFPNARLVDAELAVDEPLPIARIEIDLDAETTSYEMLG